MLNGDEDPPLPRNHVLELLQMVFAKASPASCKKTVRAVSAQLESEIFAYSTLAAPSLQLYIKIYTRLIKAFSSSDPPLASEILSGSVPLSELVSTVADDDAAAAAKASEPDRLSPPGSPGPPGPPGPAPHDSKPYQRPPDDAPQAKPDQPCPLEEEGDPRDRGCAIFHSILAGDARAAALGETWLHNCAKELERGCYNSAIEQCITSADSYRRQWDSHMFVSVYSSRLGTVASNLDPNGLVAAHVAGTLSAFDRLVSGEWQPFDLGAMAAVDLCPEATAAVRAKVDRRVNQKIDEKTSTYFACPRCKKRNHTYRLVQIGSGDEPSTFMCTCKECGEHYEGYS